MQTSPRRRVHETVLFQLRFDNHFGSADPENLSKTMFVGTQCWLHTVESFMGDLSNSHAIASNGRLVGAAGKSIAVVRRCGNHDQTFATSDTMVLSPRSSEASHLLQRNSNSLRQPLYSGAERDVSFRDNAARTPLGSAAPSPMLQQQLSRRFGVKPPAPLEKPEDMKSRVWLYALLGVVGYLCTGVIVYSTVSGMGVLDALYFCVVTLTTVGYGDLSAHKTGTKIFACFYILVGVAMVGAFLAQLVEMLLNRQEQMLLMIVDELADMTDEQEATNANTASNGLGQSRSGSSKIKRARVKVWSGVIWFFVLVLSGALIFMFAEHLSLVDALYLTVVSASTVGYGDYYPDKTVTKAFAIFFLPLTTLLLAKIVSDYTQMRVESSTQARQHRILHATITTPIFMEMDRDGDGCIDKFEFLCRQLVAQEKVEQEDIDEVMKRFNELDRNNDGTIERDEVANPAHTAINVNVT